MSTGTPSLLREVLTPLVSDLAFVDREGFTVAGKLVHDHGNGGNRFFELRADLPGVVGRLAQLVYDRYYTRGDEGRGPYAPVHDQLLRSGFQELLSRANATPYRWVDGWMVVEKPSEAAGTLRVQDPDGIERVVRDEDIKRTADSVSVRVPTSSAVRQPGFFHIGGLEDLSMSGSDTLRFYWNASLGGSVALVQALTAHASAVERPYHFKILDDPQHFRRADSAVLYIAAADLDVFLPAIAAAYGEVGHALRTETPLFTKRLAPGLGYAQDPGDGQSFGMHRSLLIAEGLWEAHLQGRTTARGRLSAVLRRFEQAGIPADSPHLGRAGSPYDVELDLADPFGSLLSSLEVSA